jgi:hypothetical protein
MTSTQTDTDILDTNIGMWDDQKRLTLMATYKYFVPSIH